jgi:hypothetical protein
MIGNNDLLDFSVKILGFWYRFMVCGLGIGTIYGLQLGVSEYTYGQGIGNTYVEFRGQHPANKDAWMWHVWKKKRLKILRSQYP